VKRRRANAPLNDGAREASGLAVQRPQGDRRAEGEADQEDPAERQVLDQAEQVVDQVLVGDPPQTGAVVGVLARIVEDDGPEPGASWLSVRA
jgi:hypothetical protein